MSALPQLLGLHPLQAKPAEHDQFFWLTFVYKVKYVIDGKRSSLIFHTVAKCNCY